jgi:oxygen-independent coproporphyrinogen III oxidase
MTPGPAGAPDRAGRHAAAAESVSRHDTRWPASAVAELLRREENTHLLEYVAQEAFTHVFPGDRPGYPPGEFFADLDRELREAGTYHLWAEVPLCKYRCHFCQFPILVLGSRRDAAEDTARRWVDANIAEARIWLDKVPALREVPIGEFCLFGGTPSALPARELERLTDFYLSEFRTDGGTTLRAEGSPDTLDEGKLGDLHSLGYTILTYGIQSFDDQLLALANRRHTGRQAREAIAHARAAGFTRVDGDLVWGLPGQDVGKFLDDVQAMVDLAFSTIVIIKLHLRSFREVTSAIGHDTRAAWEDEETRQRIAQAGNAWPSLGEQFQMREQATSLLAAAGYGEHPATYFPHRTAGPERWRSLNLDQDQQRPQVGIGLGGYTWSSRSEASVTTTPARYLKEVNGGEIPFETVTRLSPEGREVRSVRMALSTCQPLREDVHQHRFPGSSLLSGRWGTAFGSLQRRGLARVDHAAGTVSLTREGATLVEAIIGTEIA